MNNAGEVGAVFNNGKQNYDMIASKHAAKMVGNMAYNRNDMIANHHVAGASPKKQNQLNLAKLGQPKNAKAKPMTDSMERLGDTGGRVA